MTLIEQLEELALLHERTAAQLRATIMVLARPTGNGGGTLVTHHVDTVRSMAAAAPPLDLAGKLALFHPRSAVSLEDLRKVVPAPQMRQLGLGALERHGYLRKTAKGYVRTTKAVPA